MDHPGFNFILVGGIWGGGVGGEQSDLWSSGSEGGGGGSIKFKNEKTSKKI